MNTKILALAALTALSLGVGSAMAQNGTTAPATQAPQASATVAPQQAPVQYGSSDHNYGVTSGYDANITAGGF